jgi:ankyrin repeat protein
MNGEEDTPIEDFCDRLNPEVLSAFIEATTKDALKAVFSRDISFVLASVDTKFTSEERIKMIKLMLHYNAKVDLGKGFNVTALHQAAEINSSDIVDLLVRHGVCVDAQDPQLRTPLHYACQAGSMAVVKTLLCHGAKLQVRTIEGKTPFMTSVLFGKMEIARLILEGSDREAVDSLGCNALLIAAKSAEDMPDMLAFLIVNVGVQGAS